VIWGIDSETGQFKLLGDHPHHAQNSTRGSRLISFMPNLWSSRTLPVPQLVPRSSIISPSTIVAMLGHEHHNSGKNTIVELIHDDIEHLLTELVGEEEKFRRVYLSEKAKMARLLFLFQKDLMPGLQGMILESKERRDQVVVKGVSRSAKLLAWLFLALLDGGMLFYIFLFAFSQTTHRQSAWAQSFVLWLVTEIFLVSTTMVCLMHILLPFLVMKDVTRIQSKLMDSVMGYYQNLAAAQETKKDLICMDDNSDMEKEESDTDEEEEEEKKNSVETGIQGRPRLHSQAKKKKSFNAAEYLFLSYRLAKCYPDLKVSKIITQFSTPWPRQSYQHVIDVSQSYSSRFKALSRSISIVVLFFVSNLVTVPANLQDMICQLFSTTMIGYTILLHVQLYAIFPVLVIVPLAFIALIVHFVIRANARNAQIAQQHILHPHQNKEHANKDNSPSPQQQGQQNSLATADQNNAVSYHPDEQNFVEEAIYFVPKIETSEEIDGKKNHLSRRATLTQGVDLLQQAQYHCEEDGDEIDTNKYNHHTIIEEMDGEEDESDVEDSFDDIVDDIPLIALSPKIVPSITSLSSCSSSEIEYTLSEDDYDIQDTISQDEDDCNNKPADDQNNNEEERESDNSWLDVSDQDEA